MAKAAWCTVTPTTGTGNKSIAISAAVHTGRVARTTAVIVQNQSGAKPTKEIAVSQAGTTIYITKVSGPTPASIPAAGGVIVVTGKSNAKMINLFENSDWMSAHEFKANGVLQTDSNNDYTYPQFFIAGDPGASGEYTFESKVTIPANTDAESRQIGIMYEGCMENVNEVNPPTFTVTIPQAGATSALSIDKNSPSIVTAGAAQNIAITSNDSWIIS